MIVLLQAPVLKVETVLSYVLDRPLPKGTSLVSVRLNTGNAGQLRLIFILIELILNGMLSR